MSSLEQALKCNPCLNFYLVELFFKASTKTLKNGYFYSQTENTHVTHLTSFCCVCLDAEQRKIYLPETVLCLVLRKSSTVKFPEALACGVFSTHLSITPLFQFTQKCVLKCLFLYSTISFCQRIGTCPKLTFRILFFNGCIQFSFVNLKSLLEMRSKSCLINSGKKLLQENTFTIQLLGSSLVFSFFSFFP